jgi:RecA-family ATPase
MNNPLSDAVTAPDTTADLRERYSHVRSLGELLADPSLTQLPTPIIPSFAYEGRVTLLSGREKSGKSTLVGQALSALSAGSAFLDNQLEKRRTLWLALDEPLGDLVRRAGEYGADPANFLISDERPESAHHLADLIRHCRADAVVVDTLSELWSVEVKNENDATEVGPFMRAYTRVARDTGAGLIFLHHLPKARGPLYRGSTALGAAVDILARLTHPRPPGTDADEDDGDYDDGRRVLVLKGRGGIAGTLALSFDGSHYSRGDAPLPLPHRVLSAVSQGAVSSTAVANRLGSERMTCSHRCAN